MFFNKTFIGDCPLFLNKTVYQRLSNAFFLKGLSVTVHYFLINQFIGNCPMLLK